MLSRVFKTILDWLYPPKCPFCRRLLKDDERLICFSCLKSPDFTEKEHQVVNGKFFQQCYVPLFYRDKVREAFLRYKFNNCQAYIKPFGKLMADCVKENSDAEFDFITWIPVSHKRKRKRGFDQSELLAREIGELLGLEVKPTLLKIAHTPAQSSLADKSQRAANVLGVYEAAIPSRVKGKTILLVDDILTTGATMNEGARTLMAAGASKIYAAAFARSVHL